MAVAAVKAVEPVERLLERGPELVDKRVAQHLGVLPPLGPGRRPVAPQIEPGPAHLVVQPPDRRQHAQLQKPGEGVDVPEARPDPHGHVGEGR